MSFQNTKPGTRSLSPPPNYHTINMPPIGPFERAEGPTRRPVLSDHFYYYHYYYYGDPNPGPIFEPCCTPPPRVLVTLLAVFVVLSGSAALAFQAARYFGGN